MAFGYGAVPTGGVSLTNPDFGKVDMSAAPQVLPRILKLGLRYPGRAALAIACSLGAAIAGLTMPKLFGSAVEEVQTLLNAGTGHQGDAQKSLWMLAGLVLLASTMRGFLTMAAGYQGEWVSQRVGYELRNDFFRKLQRLSFGFHDKIHSGDLITRGMLDLDGTRLFIQGGLMSSLTLLLLLVVATLQMVLSDWRMALIGLTFVPIAGWALARMGILLRVTWLKFQQLMSILTLVMEENLQGIRVVRAFAATSFELGKFDKAAKDALAFSYQRIILRLRAQSVMTLSFYSSMAALLWYGGHRVIDGHMGIRQLTEFILYMNMLQAPIRQIAMIFMSAARATSSGGRLFEILDAPEDITDKPGAKDLEVAKGVLRFEHVGFHYDRAGKEILHDISFEVAPGKTLGIVGAPGSGKSTIANLVPRFYDPTSGRITLDGQDLRDVTLASLRDHVGLVQQEAFLFDATVTNNVAYADPWADEDRITGAAKTAQIHDYVANLPGAYNTRVGERGVALSGGQRQRMSIARGVVPGPGVMIFDDSTAAIDAVTEKKVRDALAAATKQKATIIIAHRLSSLMHADEILVLDEGRVTERGTHAELVALGGEYADLFKLQTRTEQGLSVADITVKRHMIEETGA